MKIKRLSMNRDTRKLYNISMGNLLFCRIGIGSIDVYDSIVFGIYNITGRIVILMDDALIFSYFSSRYNV